MANNYLFRLNTTDVPDGYKPRGCSIVVPKPTGKSLSGKPIGARGWPYAVLTWEEGDLTVEAFQWWDAWVGAGFLSVALSNVVLPNPRYTGTFTHPDTEAEYPNHQQWSSGRLQFPDTDEGGGMDQRSVSGTVGNWVVGARSTLYIWDLGR